MRIAFAGVLFVAMTAHAFSPSSAAFSLRPASLSLRSSNKAVSLKMCETATAESRISEIKAVLAELAEFKNRIVDSSIDQGKKIKAKPKDVQNALAQHPDVIKIDEAVATLETELKQLGGA